MLHITWSDSIYQAWKTMCFILSQAKIMFTSFMNNLGDQIENIGNGNIVMKFSAAVKYDIYSLKNMEFYFNIFNTHDKLFLQNFSTLFYILLKYDDFTRRIVYAQKWSQQCRKYFSTSIIQIFVYSFHNVFHKLTS